MATALERTDVPIATWTEQGTPNATNLYQPFRYWAARFQFSCDFDDEADEGDLRGYGSSESAARDELIRKAEERRRRKR